MKQLTKEIKAYIKLEVNKHMDVTGRENAVKGFTLLGYSVEDIASALGVKVDAVNRILTNYEERVHGEKMSYDEYKQRFREG